MNGDDEFLTSGSNKMPAGMSSEKKPAKKGVAKKDAAKYGPNDLVLGKYTVGDMGEKLPHFPVPYSFFTLQDAFGVDDPLITHPSGGCILDGRSP